VHESASLGNVAALSEQAISRFVPRGLLVPLNYQSPAAIAKNCSTSRVELSRCCWRQAHAANHLDAAPDVSTADVVRASALLLSERPCGRGREPPGSTKSDAYRAGLCSIRNPPARDRRGSNPSRRNRPWEKRKLKRTTMRPMSEDHGAAPTSVTGCDVPRTRISP
jgi:hypothetical protein